MSEIGYFSIILLSCVVVLVIDSVVLHVITWRRQNKLVLKISSLITKVDQRMAGVLELSDNEDD